MANRWGENGNWQILFSWAPKSLWTVTAAMKVNNICSLEEKLWQSKTELKSRGITLLTKLHIVKAMIYPVVMYRCESWIIKKAESESRSAISNTLQLHWLYSPWNSLSQNTGVGSPSLLQGIFPTQGSNPGLPLCRQIFLAAEPPRKPKNTGVGSLSLLQQIFLTKELNRDLLHWQILYQLSYQGSPMMR